VTRKAPKKKVDIKYLGIPNVCFSLTEKTDKREKEFKKQRIKRGFDNSETWSLDSTIARFIVPRIQVFREVTCGVPAHLENASQWDDILAAIQKSFEMTIDDCALVWTRKEEREYRKGMRLFSKYFTWLWW
jgi:hypothetical protein